MTCVWGLLQAELAGESDDKEFIRLEAERAEFERAKERLTLKHKNTSQWARRALKRGVVMKDTGESHFPIYPCLERHTVKPMRG